MGGAYMIPLAGQPAPRENPTQAYDAGAQSYLQQQATQQQTNNLAANQQLIEQQAENARLQNQAAQLDLNIKQKMAGVLFGGNASPQPAAAPAPQPSQPVTPLTDPSAPGYLSSGSSAMAPYIAQSPAPRTAGSPSIPSAYSAPAGGNPMAAALAPPAPTAPAAPAPAAAISGVGRIQQYQSQMQAAGVPPSYYQPVIKSMLETEKTYSELGTSALENTIKQHSMLNGSLQASFSDFDPDSGKYVWTDPTQDQWDKWLESSNLAPKDMANIQQLHPPGQPPTGQQLQAYSHTLYLDTEIRKDAKDEIAMQGEAQKNTHEAAMYPGQETEQGSKTATAALQTTAEQSKVDADARNDAAISLRNAALRGRQPYLDARDQAIAANPKLAAVNWPEPPAPNQYKASDFAKQVGASVQTAEQGLTSQQLASHQREMEAIAQQNADTRQQNADKENALQHKQLISSLADKAVSLTNAAGGTTLPEALANVNNQDLFNDGDGAPVGQYRGEVAQELQNRISGTAKTAAQLANINARTAAIQNKGTGVISPIQQMADMRDYAKANPGQPAPDAPTLAAWKSKRAPAAAVPVNKPANPATATIRVKLADGRTGSIDAADFDAKTMTKIQ